MNFTDTNSTLVNDTRSQKYSAKVNHLCPLPMTGKSFNMRNIEKVMHKRAEKRQRDVEREQQMLDDERQAEEDRYWEGQKDRKDQRREQRDTLKHNKQSEKKKMMEEK